MRNSFFIAVSVLAASQASQKYALEWSRYLQVAGAVFLASNSFSSCGKQAGQRQSLKDPISDGAGNGSR
jgi:hypothetical protein